MSPIMEPAKRIDPATDFTIAFQCGCRVVFLGDCFHHSSRMDCCAGHAARDGFEERHMMHEQAKQQYKLLEIMQPPR